VRACICSVPACILSITELVFDQMNHLVSVVFCVYLDMQSVCAGILHADIHTYIHTGSAQGIHTRHGQTLHARSQKARSRSGLTYIHACTHKYKHKYIHTYIIQVAHKAYIRDMGKRSMQEAKRLAEQAALHRLRDGLTEALDQDIRGGIMLRTWTRDTVPETHELETLFIKQKENGTWIDRARKNVRIKFEAGQKDIVKQPRIIEDNRTYVGIDQLQRGASLGGKIGPKWSELYVGEVVLMTAEALIRREKYGLGDKSGALEHRQKGFIVEKSIEMSKGDVFACSSVYAYAMGTWLLHVISKQSTEMSKDDVFARSLIYAYVTGTCIHVLSRRNI
jgi:hypothetical protein